MKTLNNLYFNKFPYFNTSYYNTAQINKSLFNSYLMLMSHKTQALLCDYEYSQLKITLWI